MLKASIFLFFIFSVFIPYSSTQAVGMSIKPKELVVELKAGYRETTELLVTNTGEEPILYQVNPDKYIKNTIVYPADFRLEPNGSQALTIKFKKIWPGQFNYDISVVARPLNVSGISAATGIKVPVKLRVSAWFIKYLALLILVIFSILLYNKFTAKPKSVNK